MSLDLHHLAMAVERMERNYKDLYEVRVSESRDHLERIAVDLEDTAQIVRRCWIEEYKSGRP